MSLPPDFLHELKKRFTGDLRFDPASKALYSTDASIYQIEPLGVAIPRTQEDLQAAVELGVKYKIPILPRGSGSSLAGQAVGEALILDCSRHLDKILEVDVESQSAIVEPGVILADLNRAASRHGLMFGPDPASAERATMGGVIANNATGAHSILYGMSADHVLEADVILGSGNLATFGEWDVENGVQENHPLTRLQKNILQIRENYSAIIKQNYPKSWRNSAGYRLNYLLPWSPSAPSQWGGDRYPSNQSNSKLNIAPLLAGSEGTLAVIRRMKVNLVKKPKHTILGVLSYRSIEDACDDVPRLLEFKPSAVELIPQMILRLARSVPAYARQMGWVAGDPVAVLVVEFSGDQPSALKEAVRRLGDVLTIAESAEEQARVWNVRKMGLGILDSRPQSARPVAFIEDCAVPVERLGEFVGEIERILAAHQTEGGIYAHASGGCLHIRPVLNLKTRNGVYSLRSIAEQVLALTLCLGGSMSSEHGDGIARGEWIEATYGAELVEAMRSLKRAVDPYNLLNPTKMFDAPRMDSNLRFGEDYQADTWNSSLHFEHENGLAGVIEMCNGQGVCRKDTGVMCPSFQATREESNSTRGRANLLRALIAVPDEIRKNRGKIEASAYQALDLCLACKGCTSECPSGVDMPRLKYEFMNEYYKSHRRPLHDYLFGYFHVVARWLAPIAPLANLFMEMGWSHKVIARISGITEKRPFPLFAGNQAKPANDSMGNKKTVIFLSDVFSKYLEPQVAQAAFDILSVLGYEVKVLETVGSGASLLAKGFVNAAKKHAGKVLDEIKALGGGADVSVVGCEPPEVYCLKHEYHALLPERRAEIESIAKNVWLVDEFVLRVDNLVKNMQVDENKAKVIFHPHCHQRAEGLAEDGLPIGTLATTEMLRIAGYKVEVTDAGCCGMAGTFGYDDEHYDLSMQIGELKLLPKLRSEKLDGEVVSSGSACRIQIKHGAGVPAKHPLELVRDILVK